MNEPHQPPGMADKPATPDEAALFWFVRLRDAAAGEPDRRRHADWLAADPRHRAAWQDVQQLWAALDQAAPQAAATPRRRILPMGLRTAALAASILLACIVGWQAAPPGLLADERSGIGERRTVTLADGSAVELGTGSALTVRFREGERRVVLHRGEAFFAVAHDPARPFVVEAGAGNVTVLGTRFDVKLEAPRVDVAVAEGSVAVTAGDGSYVRLSQGEAAGYGPGGVSAPAAVDLRNATAWRNDRLVFQNVPLGQVVRELERYRWGRIVVAGDRLAAMPVTGVFDTRRTDAAIETIARNLPVRLIHLTGLLTVLTAAR